MNQKNMNSAKWMTVGRWLRRRAEAVAAALLLIMFLCFILTIVARYVFNYPLGWTEEASLIAWIWCTLWGAVFVLREKDEVRFDILYGNVPEGVRRVFTVITGLALIILYGVSLPAAYGFVAFMKVERSAYLHVPINYLYSIYVIFAVACIVRHVWLIWNAVRGRSPSAEPAEVADRV